MAVSLTKVYATQARGQLPADEGRLRVFVAAISIARRYPPRPADGPGDARAHF